MVPVSSLGHLQKIQIFLESHLTFTYRTTQMAEQKGNITANNNVIYVGGVAQIKTSNVNSSQPSEYEAFRSSKAYELANFFHNPHVELK